MGFPGTPDRSARHLPIGRHITQRGLPMDKFVAVDNAVGLVEIKEKSDARV
jgi:hypothetical protein